MTKLYEFSDYKKFLNHRLDELDSGGRGSRARMSRAIGCQTAYTAQVLRGHAHFSLEQGEAINQFLGHTEDQGQFFLLLLQIARAGTPALKSRFVKQLNAIKESLSLLKNRLGVKENLADRDQVLYYSSWHFGAIHALISIPGFQRPEVIAERLRIDVRSVSEAIEFLVRAGLVDRSKNASLTVGKTRIHLGADSPWISKHHMNWRFQAIRAIEEDPKKGLHYSSVVSISKSDEIKVREKIEDVVKSIKAVVRESKEEELCSFSLDFFRLP